MADEAALRAIPNHNILYCRPEGWERGVREFTCEVVEHNGHSYYKMNVQLAHRGANGEAAFNPGDKVVTAWMSADKSEKVFLEFVVAYARQTASWNNAQLQESFRHGQGGWCVTSNYGSTRDHWYSIRPHEHGELTIWHKKRCGTEYEPLFHPLEGGRPGVHQRDGRSRGDTGEKVTFNKDELREIWRWAPKRRPLIGADGYALRPAPQVGADGAAAVAGPAGAAGDGAGRFADGEGVAILYQAHAAVTDIDALD